MSRGQRKGFKHSEESKRKISEAMKKNLPVHAFKPGNKPPAHAFQKGHATWNKGIKMPEMGLARTGAKHHNWRGGEIQDQGYIWIYNPLHPRARRQYVRRADLIMEGMLGRPLEDKEVVHHKNRDRKDDRPDNLQLCADRSEHMSIHRKDGL